MSAVFDDVSAGAKPADAAKVAAERRETRQKLAKFLSTDSRIGLTHFIVDVSMYAGLIAGALYFENWALKILCSVVAGLKIGNLGTLGHDAGHGNLVTSSRWNTILGVICFLPGLFNWRLWIYDHHHVHHPFTNGDHDDSWTPMSKLEFDALPKRRQILERVYRSRFGLGLAPYYMIERWWAVKFMPGAFLPRRFHASAWRYFALTMTYLTVWLAFLAAAPLYSNTSSLGAIVVGFVIPFYVWMTVFSFTVYVQHTHKRIPWFKGPVNRRAAMPQETLSLHLDMPKWAKEFTHNVFEHAAHHVNVRIPFHRLADAQAELNKVAGESAVVQRFTPGWFYETMRDCKLYDFERHCWCDFDGRPTGPQIIDERRRVLIAAAGPGTQYVKKD